MMLMLILTERLPKETFYLFSLVFLLSAAFPLYMILSTSSFPGEPS